MTDVAFAPLDWVSSPKIRQLHRSVTQQTTMMRRGQDAQRRIRAKQQRDSVCRK